MGDEQGHVFFGKIVTLLKDGGAVVGYGFHDRRVSGRQVRYRDQVVLIRRKASIIVVERVADDFGRDDGIKADLIDAAQHLADLLFIDRILFVHIQIGQCDVLCGGSLAAFLKLFGDLALQQDLLGIFDSLDPVDHGVGFCFVGGVLKFFNGLIH